MCNKRFEELEYECRIDHRSYEEQGVSKIPTIHEGPAVKAMEKKGVRTRKGDFNRWVKKTNEMLATLGEEIKALITWITATKEALKEMFTKESAVVDLLFDYERVRNVGAYSNKAKVNNSKKYMEQCKFLMKYEILSMDDLKTEIESIHSRWKALRDDVRTMENEKKDLQELLKLCDDYHEFKDIANEYYSLKSKSKQEQFFESHRREMTIYRAASRHLKERGFSKENPIKPQLYRKQLDELEEQYVEKYAEYKEISKEKKEIDGIKKCVDEVLKPENQKIKKSLEVSR